jgi:hypothetical protein
VDRDFSAFESNPLVTSLLILRGLEPGRFDLALLSDLY